MLFFDIWEEAIVQPAIVPLTNVQVRPLMYETLMIFAFILFALSFAEVMLPVAIRSAEH